jgi:hypothetical protein
MQRTQYTLHLQGGTSGLVRFIMTIHTHNSICARATYILLRLELCTEGHGDIVRYPFRLAVACKMAQDLDLHRLHAPDHCGDQRDI